MYEALMELVVADENCRLALKAVNRNKGAAGIDRMTTAQPEPHFEASWWILKDKLLKGTYVPSPVKRVEIPKPSGGTRMLGIPTVQDRCIQQMLLQVLTPIFDPQFSEHSYGFRPGRSAQDAVRAAQKYAQGGKDWVVDIDITKFFDHVNHDILVGRIAQVIRDKRVLHLIGRYLRRGAMVDGLVEAGVEGTPQGGPLSPLLANTPQGGVISPLLANLYMNRFLKYWRLQEKGKQYRAEIVAYADDFVILSRGHAEQAREWTQTVMSRIGLTLNEQKTSIRDGRTEDFGFPGYTFGPRWWWKNGRKYTAARPSLKSIKRLRQSVHDLLRPNLCAPWEEVRDQLNAKLAGWQNYFRYGTVAKAYQGVNLYVYDRVRHFLRRRHKATSSKGSTRFPITAVFGPLGVHRMRMVRR
jgi:RNA-directed DNA polymerase